MSRIGPDLIEKTYPDMSDFGRWVLKLIYWTKSFIYTAVYKYFIRKLLWKMTLS